MIFNLGDLLPVTHFGGGLETLQANISLLILFNVPNSDIKLAFIFKSNTSSLTFPSLIPNKLFLKIDKRSLFNFVLFDESIDSKIAVDNFLLS